MRSFTVYYMRPDFLRDGLMGYEFLKGISKVPTAATLEKTHVKLGVYEAHCLVDLFRYMQGEVWSPNGEARELIKSLGLVHTSMSVGDIVGHDKSFYLCDTVGWVELGLE